MITYLYKNLVAFDLQHAGALIDDFVLEQRQLVLVATGQFAVEHSVREYSQY